MKYFSFFIFSLLLISCNKVGVKDNPIPIEQIFGTYDLWNGKKIIFYQDSTYVYLYIDNGVVKSDTGIWNYQYFEPPLKFNLIKSFDMRAVSKNGEKKYYTEYATFYFYVCKHW